MDIQNTPPVLVVEDDGLIRMDLVSILEDLGFAVLEAASADQAIGIMNETDISALLTDIDMPGSMNGLELANLAAELHPHSRIVVISGRFHPETRMLPDCATFLTKPVSEETLENTFAEIGLKNAIQG